MIRQLALISVCCAGKLAVRLFRMHNISNSDSEFQKQRIQIILGRLNQLECRFGIFFTGGYQVWIL